MLPDYCESCVTLHQHCYYGLYQRQAYKRVVSWRVLFIVVLPERDTKKDNPGIQDYPFDVCDGHSFGSIY